MADDNNTVSLRDYFDAKLEALATAVSLSREDLIAWKHAHNEWQKQMGDTIHRAEYERAHSDLSNKIHDVENERHSYIRRPEWESTQQENEKKFSALNKFMWGALAVVGTVSVLVGVLMHFILPGK